MDAHVPKSRAAEEHRNNQQEDQAAKIEVAEVDLDWQHKGELFLLDGPTTPQAIKGEMQHTGGLVIEGWT